MHCDLLARVLLVEVDGLIKSCFAGLRGCFTLADQGRIMAFECSVSRITSRGLPLHNWGALPYFITADNRPIVLLLKVSRERVYPALTRLQRYTRRLLSARWFRGIEIVVKIDG
jgi:hypothetical protein